VRTTLALTMVLMSAGCDGLFGPGYEASAYVRVVDHRDRKLMPDQVIWYYPPSSAKYDGEHPARCLGAGCSRWGVPAEVSGAAYVSADRSRPTRDPYCAYTASDATPITASAEAPPTVKLVLDTRVVSCE
jgi:hypothetical protein